MAQKNAGVDYHDKQFAFHMNNFHDKGLIEREDGKGGFGLIRNLDGTESWAIVPLRLTAQGHEFLEAIRNKEVWAAIKRHFKEGSFGTLLEVSTNLLDGYTKKKIEALLGL